MRIPYTSNIDREKLEEILPQHVRPVGIVHTGAAGAFEFAAYLTG